MVWIWEWTWFDLNWPWLGLAISAALLLLLFTTNVLRSELGISRWRDPVWLSWLAPAAYMIHQTEEYGVDLYGQFFAFPNLLCMTFGQPPYPACNVPPLVFVAINISAIWIGGLVCALLSRRHPLFGLSLYGVYFVNALSHIGIFAATGNYNAGVLTALVILLPLSVWVGYAMANDSRVRKSGVVVLVGVGLGVHVVLLDSLVAFSRSLIGGGVLVGIQVVNPAWYLGLPWLKEWRDRVHGIDPTLSRYR